MRPKCLKTRVLTKKYVLKEKFKNIATHYFPDLSAYMIYELICKDFDQGGTSRVLPSSCSRKEAILLLLHMYAGFGRKIKQKRGIRYNI